MARTTPRSEYRHTCGFCNTEYALAESVEACGHCGTHIGCKKIVCPKCGYEEAEPPAWIISMTGFLSGLTRRASKPEPEGASQ